MVGRKGVALLEMVNWVIVVLKGGGSRIYYVDGTDPSRNCGLGVRIYQ